MECKHVYSRNEEACPQCGCPTAYTVLSKHNHPKTNPNWTIKSSHFLQVYVPKLQDFYTQFIVKYSVHILSAFSILLLIIWGFQNISSNEPAVNNEVEIPSENETTSTPIDVSNMTFPVAIKPAQRVGVLKVEEATSQTKFDYKQASTDASSLRVVSLTTTSISLKLDHATKVVLLDAQGKLVKEKPSQSTDVTFDGLKANTVYVLMSLNSKNEYQDYLVFETMNPSEDIDLQYFINVDDSNSEEVTIDIFGYFNGVSSYTLNNEQYHTHLDELDIQHDSMSVTTNGSYDVKWTPGTKITFLFNDKQGYFQVSYTSKKTATQSADGGGRVEGRKTSDYLIATGEQILVLPVRSNMSFSEDISLSMNAPLNWGYNIGFKEPIDGFYKVEKDKEWMPLAPIQAYNLSNYTESVLTYPDLTFEFIYPNTADVYEVNQLYDAWDMLYQIWGQSPEKGLRYTLFVANDDVEIYGGEYTTGQSYTTSYGLLNEMGVHQFYHVWQGWKYYIETNESYQKWWGEGFNRYFSHKVLEAVGDKAEGYQQLGNYYSAYMGSIDQGYKTALFSNDYPFGGYEYNVGALFTYAMDKQLQTETKGAYSMDIVLNHVLQEWKENGTPFTYNGMLTYIKETTGVDFTPFFNEYLITAENPLVLDEFASNVTANSGQSSGTFGGGIYGNQGPVELFANKFKDTFKGTIEMASNEAFSETKFNNFQYTAILHSLDMREFPSSFKQFLGINSDPEMNKLNIYHNSKGGTIYVIITKTEDELMKFINDLPSLD